MLGRCAGCDLENPLLGLGILVLFLGLLTPSSFSAFLYTCLSFKDPALKGTMVRDLVHVLDTVQWSHGWSQKFREAEKGKDTQEEKVRSNLNVNFGTKANEYTWPWRLESKTCSSAPGGCSWVHRTAPMNRICGQWQGNSGIPQFCISWGSCHLLWNWERWKNPSAEILPKQLSRMAIVSIESISADEDP